MGRWAPICGRWRADGVQAMRPACHFADRGDCDGALSRHHIVEKQRIKQARSGVASRLRPGDEQPPLVSTPISKILEDERNLVVVCDRHHHQIHHAGLRLRSMPDEIDAFAVDYALGWAVEKARALHTEGSKPDVG